MPCRDDYEDENGSKKQDTAPAWMLCEAMTIIQNHGEDGLEECSSQLLAWWTAHKSKEDERVKREAVAKLSARERLALGLDETGNYVRKTVIKRK